MSGFYNDALHSARNEALRAQGEFSRQQIMGMAGLGGMLGQGLDQAQQFIPQSSGWNERERDVFLKRVKPKRDNIVNELQYEVDEWLKDTI